jgi:hypothetical protein
MKKGITVGFIVLAIYGCANNDSQPAEQNGTDTGNTIPQRPPGESNADTARRDTSMYQRMPNKTSDSTPK